MGLCPAEQADEERRAGCAWPGRRSSFHSSPTEVDGRFQPRVGAPFMRASRGQACVRAKLGFRPRPVEVRAHLGCCPGGLVQAEPPPQPRRALIKPSSGAGRGQGAGRPAGPTLRTTRLAFGGTPRSSKFRACGVGGQRRRAGVWAVGLQCGFRVTRVLSPGACKTSTELGRELCSFVERDLQFLCGSVECAASLR